MLHDNDAFAFTCMFDIREKVSLHVIFHIPPHIHYTHTHMHYNKPVNLTPRQHIFPQNMHQRREQNKQIDIYVSASGQKATNSIPHPM